MTMNAKTVRWSLLIAVVLAAVAVAGALLAHRGEREWTTDSEAALAEFELGLEAQQKFYHDEAAGHFARAVELDPDFVAAKLFLLPYVRADENDENPSRREELRAAVLAADRSDLTPRERFLIAYRFAVREDEDEALRLLEDQLEQYPDDPFALNGRCERQWMAREFAAAEDCYRRLIEIDPNWVNAQNLLGYLAMAQTEWRRAEEQFHIFRYLAPDQANPHDSLGELYLLTGRWDDARREFEEALAIKPDFVASWGNLVTIALYTGDFDEAERILEGVERDKLGGESFVRQQRCRLGVWRTFTAADWRGTLDAYRRPECEGLYGEPAMLAYEAALLAGLTDDAANLAEAIDGALERQTPGYVRNAQMLHIEGMRLRITGRPQEATERLREVDESFAYWTSSDGYFKIANRVELWSALRADGRTEEADRLLAELRAVNPPIAERWTSHPAVQPVPPAVREGSS